VLRARRYTVHYPQTSADFARAGVFVNNLKVFQF
jgi:hypothetical protein